MPADILGDMGREHPPFPSRISSEMAPWAEMLSMIGQRNSQLYDLVARETRPRPAGKAIVRELERERSRIARELHAGAGQPLAGIKLNLELLDDCLTALPVQGREAIARLQTLTTQALEQVRAVSHSLHPPEWQTLTTLEAIRNLIDSSGLVNRLAVELDLGPLPAEPSHTAKVAIYRCAQECISNIARHSGATAFKLSLKSVGSAIELRVEDNGHGFAADARREGIGLLALREHAGSLGGTFNITTGSAGTDIVIQLPLAED